VSKFRNFSEKNGIFELAKFSLKIWKKVRKKVQKLFQNVRKFRKFQKKYVKLEFLSQKPCFWVKKFGKVWKSLETGFSECLEISEIILF